jgi:hypothetical protein
MQRGGITLCASIANMACFQPRIVLCTQCPGPVDSRIFFAIAFGKAAFCLRFVPSKTMPACLSIGAFPSMVQAFFAASGLTCLTFAVPVGSGGR